MGAATWWMGRSSSGESMSCLRSGSIVEDASEQLAAGLVEGHLGGAREHPGRVEQLHHAGEDGGVAGGAQQLVPVEVLGRAAAGFLPAGDAAGPVEQTRLAGHVERFV